MLGADNLPMGALSPQAPSAAPSLNLTPRGTPGLRHAGGYVIEEFLRKLTGRNGVQQYREMHFNSPQVGAILYFIGTLIGRVPWRFEPNPASKSKSKAAQNADFFEQCWADMEHAPRDYVSQALSYLMYGWAMFEPVHKIRRGQDNPPELKSKYSDGKIGWRRFDVRSQDTLLRWEIDRTTGEVLGMWQQDPWSGRPPVYLGKEYCVHLRHRQHKNNPEGLSLFRNSVIPYLRLKRIEEIEAIGIERDLTGLLVMEVPPTILSDNGSVQDRATKAELETMLSGIKRDEREFAMIPSELDPEGKPTGFKLRLLQGGGAKQLDIVAIKNTYKTDIFQTALVQFLTLGQQSSGGSYSLHSDASSLASMAVGSILDDIQEATQREAVDRLAVLNKMEPDDVPILKHGDIEKPELEKIGQFLTVLFNTGNLQPSDALVETLHKLGGLPYDTTDAPLVSEKNAQDAKLAEQLAKPPVGEPDDNAPPGKETDPGDKPQDGKQ